MEVELPRGLDELRGPTEGVVRLPIRVAPNAPFPELVDWDLGVLAQRISFYEIVLRDGDLHDQRKLINGRVLVDLWDELYLPIDVRQAWQPLIDAAKP